MTDRLNKTSICSIVFLDIIDYSKKSDSEQIDDKTFFNELINEAIQNVAPNDRIILDTGDGAAITLMGAPEEALFISLSIRDGILERNKNALQPLLVRIGINLGSIRVMKDLNDRPNIIGDGINVAQRIMSFAEANQILVSRSYYEVTSRLTKEITSMFSYSGVKQDKHIREHEVYVIKSKDEAAAISQENPDFYSIGGMRVPVKKFTAAYFIPITVAALLLALMAWYLLVLRPIPNVSKELTSEDITAVAPAANSLKQVVPVQASKLTVNHDNQVIKNLADIQTESSSPSLSQESKSEAKLENKPAITSKETKLDKPLAKIQKKPAAQKEVVKPNIAKPAVEEKTNTQSALSNTKVKQNKSLAHTEVTISKAETKSNHQIIPPIEPVLKHVCTQAEIAMNQCSK